MIQFELNFFAQVAEFTSSKPKTGAIRMQFEFISIDFAKAFQQRSRLSASAVSGLISACTKEVHLNPSKK